MFPKLVSRRPVLAGLLIILAVAAGVAIWFLAAAAWPKHPTTLSGTLVVTDYPASEWPGDHMGYPMYVDLELLAEGGDKKALNARVQMHGTGSDGHKCNATGSFTFECLPGRYKAFIYEDPIPNYSGGPPLNPPRYYFPAEFRDPQLSPWDVTVPQEGTNVTLTLHYPTSPP